MAKKVLIISSSPRKGGNSDMLCDEFMKGVIETGNEVEKIFIILVRDAVFAVCTESLVRRRMMRRKSWRR